MRRSPQVREVGLQRLGTAAQPIVKGLPMHVSRLALFALLLAAAGSACCTENRCMPHPSLIVVVTDADTGEPLLDVRVVAQTQDGASKQITNLDAGLHDPWPAARNVAHIYETGGLRITIENDGYVSTSFDVHIDEDICGLAIGQRRDVALQKVGSARQAVITEAAGSKQRGQ